MYEFKKYRSRFWLKIHDNDVPVDKDLRMSANGLTSRLIDASFPQLERSSAKGWVKSNNLQDVYNLCIPENNYTPEDIEDLIIWAERVNQYIWLNTNRNTEAFFSGTELEFCLAYDWNFDFETHDRTSVGEAEYWLKYRSWQLSEEQRKKYVRVMTHAVYNCVMALPNNHENYIVTTVPATKDKQSKLSWALAQYVARTFNIPFVGLTLAKEKPQMKSLPLADKIRIWREIYSDDTEIAVPADLNGKNVLVVDDLFQSGASLFCYAEFLKYQLGVQQVDAVTSVKSQRDGDNT